MIDRMHLLLALDSKELFLYIPEGTQKTAGRAAKIRVENTNLTWIVSIEIKKDEEAERVVLGRKGGKYKLFKRKCYDIHYQLALLIQKLLELEKMKETNSRFTLLKSEINVLKVQVSPGLQAIINLNKKLLGRK